MGGSSPNLLRPGWEKDRGAQPLPSGPTGTVPQSQPTQLPTLALTEVLLQPAEAFLAKRNPGQGPGLDMLGACTLSSPQDRRGVGVLGSHSDSGPMGPGRIEGAKLGRMDTPKWTMVSGYPS